MSYTVKLGFTSGDQTYPILKGSIEAYVGKEGKHATQSTPVKVQSAACAALLLTETADLIPAVLYHDETVIFDGYIRPYRTIGAKGPAEDPVSLQIMDATEAMHVVTGTDVVYTNKTVAQLVSFIYAASGATPTLGSIPADLSTYSLDRFRIAADEYWDDVLSELLYEYGYDFVFTPGACQIQKTTVDEAPNQSITDIRNNYRVERADNTIDGTIVEYKKVAFKQNVSIYSDDTRFDATKTGLGRYRKGNYYNGLMHDDQGTPPAGNLVSWNYSLAGVDGLSASNVLSVTNVDFDFSIEDEDGIEMTEHFDQQGSDLLTGARWWLYYQGTFNRVFGIGWGWVIKAHADITYLVDGNWQYKCEGDDPKKISAKYITNEDAAKAMASREYKRFKVCKTKYTFDSLTDYNVGEFYNLTETTVGVDTVVRVISKSLSDDGIYSYQCEGADSIGLSVTVKELQVRDIAAVSNLMSLETDKLTLFGPADEAVLTAVGFVSTMQLSYKWYINGALVPGSSNTLTVRGEQLVTGYNTIKCEALEEGVVLVSRELELEYIVTQKVNYGTELNGEGTVRGYAGAVGDYYINTETWDLYKCIEAGNAYTALWKFIKNTQGEPVTVNSFTYEIEYGLSSSDSEFIFPEGSYGYDSEHVYGIDSSNSYGFKNYAWSPTVDGWYHGLYVWQRIKVTDIQGNIKYEEPTLATELTQSLEDSCVIDVSSVPEAYTSNMRRTDSQYLRLNIADIGYRGTLILRTDTGVFASYDAETEQWTDLTNALTITLSNTSVVSNFGLKLPYAMDSNVLIVGDFEEWNLNQFSIKSLSICPSIEKNTAVQLETVNTYADLPTLVNKSSQDANINDNLIKGDYILVKFLTLTATSTTQATDETGKLWNITELSSYYDSNLDPITVSAFVVDTTYYAFAIYAWMYDGTQWTRNPSAAVEINTVKEAVDLAQTQHDLDPTVDYHRCLYAHQILVEKLTAGVINVGNIFVNDIESTNYTEETDGTPTTGYKLVHNGGEDGAGVIKSVGGVYANMNVVGVLNLTKPNGASAAEIIHPAITTVKGMPGDPTGKTADTPTRWKVKELTDKITTQNNPVSVVGSYGSDTASKLLNLTDFSALKGNCIGTIYTSSSSAGITLDKVIYGNGVYVGFYTTGNVVHPEGHIYTSTDRQNWTERLGGTDAYAAYNSGNFYNGYFYAYFGGTNTPGGVGFYKSLDGINWTFITVFHSSTGRGVRTMVMGRGFVFFYYTVGSTIYRCTDTFTNLQTMSSDTVMGLFSDVDNCFYSLQSDGIYASPDCLTWTRVGSLPPRQGSSTSLYFAVANGILFVSEEGYYSYYSYNEGQTWTKTSSSYSTVRAAIVVGSRIITNPQGTSRWRADLNYSLQGLFPEDVGKYFYYSNSWKELVPDAITDTHAVFTSGIVFDSDNYINYRLLSNFIGYTSYTYVDPDDRQTKTQSIELGFAYRVNSIGFKINNTALVAVFFIRNSSTSITIVCTNGHSYTFTSGNYYYVEGSIAIADTVAGVEMMGQYPAAHNAYDVGTPTKVWRTGYFIDIVMNGTSLESRISALEQAILNN